MTSSPDTRDRLPRDGWSTRLRTDGVRGVLGSYPRDLAVLSLYAGLGGVAAAVSPAGSVLRFVVSLPLLFLLPGYAVLSLLYPAADSLPVGPDATATRAALAFGVSLAILPLSVLAIGAVVTPAPLAVLAGLTVGSVLVAQGAAIRRVRVPADRRYRSDVRRRVGRALTRVGGRSRFATMTAVLLALGLVVATGAVVLAVAQSPSASEFTQLYVGTEGENGTVSTADYPEELTGETPFVVGVENHERGAEAYVVLVRLQAVTGDGDVLESQRVARFEQTVGPGETWRRPHRVSPELSGDDLRLQYLLYRDDPPTTPTEASAYRSVHVWVDGE